MKTFPTLFTQEKNRKRGAAPVWILKCPFPSTGTIYLSDNVFAVPSWNGGITTKAWVAEWGNIDENISFGAGSPSVSSFRLDLISSQKEFTDLSTILWTAANNIETTDCELYLWFIGLNPATDPPQKVWTGNIVDFRQTSDLIFEVEFADQSVKNNKIIGNFLNAATYPNLPSTSVGVLGPVVYGSVSKTKPLCIQSAGFSKLTEDLDTTETGIDVRDGSSFPASAFWINVNGELCHCSSRTGNTLTVTRSSTPSAHSIGDPVLQADTTYLIYMIADHPIKAVNHIYVDGIEITTGYTIYTGQAGSQHPTYPNKGILVISTMALGTDTTITMSRSGASGSGWANPSNFVDGNAATYSNSSYDSQYMTVTFTAPSEPFGVIRSQRVNCKWTANPDGSICNVYYTIGGVSASGYSGPLHTHDGWTAAAPGGSWAGAFVMWATGIRDLGGDHDGWFNAYECVSKEVTYAVYNASGDSAEEVMLGGELTCDIDGYQDDGSGTYTGTPAALIARPDHVFKHMLYTYLAIATANFSTDAATPFATDSYAFGIVIAEKKTAKEWLAKMAWECRCWFRFSAGLAYLLYRSDSLSSDMTITAAMIAMEDDGRTTVFPERSPLDEVINKIRAQYDRDWSLSGDDAYAGLYETSDATSITRYGEKEKVDLFKFDFITAAAMAQDVAAFYLARYKDRKKLVEITLLLDNAELEFADAVTIAPLENLLCEVEKVNFHPGSARDMRNDTIKLVAREY
jgi:hypothetical protein